MTIERTFVEQFIYWLSVSNSPALHMTVFKKSIGILLLDLIKASVHTLLLKYPNKCKRKQYDVVTSGYFLNNVQLLFSKAWVPGKGENQPPPRQQE